MAKSGASAYLARLKKVAPAIKRRVNVALETGAAEYAGMMRRLAPQQEGDLIESIVYYARIDAEGLVWIVAAGDDKVYYARYVEFGHGNAAARPFFYPSVRALRRRVKARVVRAWRLGIKESAA